jgi:hypothetical protein
LHLNGKSIYQTKLIGDSNTVFELRADTYYAGLTFTDFYYNGNLAYYETKDDNENVTLKLEMHEKAYNRIMNLEDNTFDLHLGWNNINLSFLGGIF